MNILNEHQYDAVERMRNGCILCGDTGSGKSRTALYYYFKENGGYYRDGKFVDMTNPKDLYIITTASKRDKHEWEIELALFCMSTVSHRIKIDSWNNIEKYKDAHDAFFIFDEQRLVSNGKWTKVFYKIARRNQWILLSATPGDKWMDYVAIFVANGFFRNMTEFKMNHVVARPFVNHFEVDYYVNEGRLLRLRERILVDLDDNRTTERHDIPVFVEYDSWAYKKLYKERFSEHRDDPVLNAAELCYELRKLVNSDPSRIQKCLEIYEKCTRAIIFYSFDYELDILKGSYWGKDVAVAEWNGHKHQPVPETVRWVYLVQYTAGCEGWNCITTDTIIFFSQSYSYKQLEQARGRIDRLTTPYHDLYYYHLQSRAPIDIAIGRALKEKKEFNKRRFFSKGGY